MKNKGKLTVISGSMFSGKTTELQKLYHISVNNTNDLDSIITVKPTLDTRYKEGKITTHDNKDIPLNVFLDSVNPEKIFDFISDKVKDIFIDETNFFENFIYDTILALLKFGINVYAAGLDRDFKNEPFGQVENLKKIADQTIDLFANCSVCGGYANYSQRLVANKPAKKTDTLVIVGNDKKIDMVHYEPRCKDHFYLIGG